jgi:ribonuclease T2
MPRGIAGASAAPLSDILSPVGNRGWSWWFDADPVVVMSKFVSRVFPVVAAMLTTAISAAYAAGFGHGEPGQFDFYVLSLSWSPSFCAAAAERNFGRRPSQQCSGRPYSFVVHGLWPQHEKGFPEYCQVPAPRLNRNIVSSMLDLMPAPGLI